MLQQQQQRCSPVMDEPHLLDLSSFPLTILNINYRKWAWPVEKFKVQLRQKVAHLIVWAAEMKATSYQLPVTS